MYKIILSILFFIILFPSALFAYSQDLTLPSNGNCFEDSHNGANGCERAFNDVLNNGNYWQNWPFSWHFVWFNFFDLTKVTRFSIINTNADYTFFIKDFHLEAETASGWVTLSTINDYTPLSGTRYYFDILFPVYAHKYRLVVDEAGTDGILITQLEFFRTDDPYTDTIQMSKSGSFLSSSGVSAPFAPYDGTETIGTVLIDIRTMLIWLSIMATSVLFYSIIQRAKWKKYV